MKLLAPAMILVSCAILPRSQRFPHKYHLVRDQLVIHSDFRLPKDHRLLDDLVAQRAHVSRTLQLPVSGQPIDIVLFDSADRYEQYMHSAFPSLPARPAFFIENDGNPAIYAHWSNRIAEDLRHEVSHGYLHSVVHAMPLWLDEGLAEFFEVPFESGGINAPHIELLLRLSGEGSWKPDLAALEVKSTAAEMLQLDYAEAWLWIHFLLKTTPERRSLLQQHLDGLRRDGTAPPLSARLVAQESSPRAAVLDHLDSLRKHVR